MFKFVEKDYKRSLWAARLLLALFGTLASLFAIESLAAAYQVLFDFQLEKSVFIYIMFGLFFAVMLELISRLLAYAAVRFAKIYTLPQNELSVWIMLAFVVKYAILSILNNLYFVTPVITVFGNILFDFVATVAAYIVLWAAIKKVYLNDKNAPHVFKSFVLIFVVLTAVSVLSGIGGVL